MRLLLDTHALIWWLEDHATLSTAAREAIADGENEVRVSAASVWELAIKEAAGKIRLPGSMVRILEDSGFLVLAITAEHAIAAGALPVHHRDPFDRMLIAQAALEVMTIVTRDADFERYGVPLLAP